MRTTVGLIGCVAALTLALALPARAQPRGHERHNPPRANQGHIPPAPQRRVAPRVVPELERSKDGRVNSMPHVNHDHWYGHDRPGDPRYRQAHPFEHGRFEHVGTAFRYDVARIDPVGHRFWLSGGFYFDVAEWDWPICADWCWDCGDDFVIYDDTDHPGWYLIYNVHTGEFVHATYMGL